MHVTGVTAAVLVVLATSAQAAPRAPLPDAVKESGETSSSPYVAPECARAGCGGQACLKKKEADRTVVPCVFRKQDECYKDAPCVYFKDTDSCHFLETLAVRQCFDLLPGPLDEFLADLKKPVAKEAPECVRAGCNGELCVANQGGDLGASTCAFKPEHICYADGGCSYNTETASCGWEPSVRECLDVLTKKQPAEEEPQWVPKCVRAGCNGELCVFEEDANSGDLAESAPTCTTRPEHACYTNEVCSYNLRIASCGWEASDSLTECLEGRRMKLSENTK